MKTREIVVQTGQTISDLLKGHDRGRTEHKLSQKLTELVSAVREHKRAGSLNIKISLDLVKGNPDRMYIIVDETLKAPESAPPCDVRYADDEGRLHERDPRQMELIDQ